MSNNLGQFYRACSSRNRTASSNEGKAGVSIYSQVLIFLGNLFGKETLIGKRVFWLCSDVLPVDVRAG